jgi:hypothetical protein
MIPHSRTRHQLAIAGFGGRRLRCKTFDLHQTKARAPVAAGRCVRLLGESRSMFWSNRICQAHTQSIAITAELALARFCMVLDSLPQHQTILGHVGDSMFLFYSFIIFCFAFLFAVPASAEVEFWKCSASVTTNYSDDATTKNGVSREFQASSEAQAISIATVYWSSIPKHPTNPISSKFVSGVKCAKPEFSKKKGERDGRTSPAPPLPPVTKAKPSLRAWTCRVKLTWQVGARKAHVDETWDDIEATSEAQAMGLAIQRSQSRLKALSLAGTNPAWPNTNAKCS